jgi:hypothetical protein
MRFLLLLFLFIHLPRDPCADDGCYGSWNGNGKGHDTVDVKSSVDLTGGLATAGGRGGRTG